MWLKLHCILVVYLLPMGYFASHVVRAIASGFAKKDDFFISCAQQGNRTNQEIYRQIELCGLFILQGTLCFMRVESYQSLYLSVLSYSLWWLSSTTKVVLSNWSVHENVWSYNPQSLCQQKWIYHYSIRPRRLFRIHAFARLSRKLVGLW
jgi:hypothetical protein